MWEHQEAALLQLQEHEEMRRRSKTTATLKLPLPWTWLKFCGATTVALRWNPVEKQDAFFCQSNVNKITIFFNKHYGKLIINDYFKTFQL